VCRVAIVETGVSKRSTSKTSALYVVSVTVSLSSICHVAPGDGFQQSPDDVDVVGKLEDVLTEVMLDALVD